MTLTNAIGTFLVLYAIIMLLATVFSHIHHDRFPHLKTWLIMLVPSLALSMGFYLMSV